MYRKKRIDLISEKHNLDMLIGSLPENIFYLSGFRSNSHRMLHRVQAYSLYDRKSGEISMVLPMSEIAAFLENNDEKVFSYGEFFFKIPEKSSADFQRFQHIIDKRHDLAENALIAAIKQAGLTKGRIGLDESRVTPQVWGMLENTFRDIDFIPAMDIFSEIRTIKHHSEIKLLEKAAEITEDSLLSALSQLKVGMSEKELGQLYVQEVVSRGGLPFFHVVSEGVRAAFVDTYNTDRKITENSFLRFDIGCIYNGFRADIARTAVMEKSPEKVSDYYKHILEGEKALIEHIKPGITAGEIFQKTVDKVREGIPHYERNHVGHGIGLEIYEPPMLIPKNDQELQPGMVMCVETPYYELGWGGVQVEDTVVVTDTGYRMLTKSSNDLIRIGDL